MKKIISATLAAVIVMAGVLLSGQFAPAQADSPTLLSFGSGGHTHDVNRGAKCGNFTRD
jgi:hypothetical protein